jgi:hypothetical protein
MKIHKSHPQRTQRDGSQVRANGILLKPDTTCAV